MLKKSPVLRLMEVIVSGVQILTLLFSLFGLYVINGKIDYWTLEGALIPTEKNTKILNGLTELQVQMKTPTEKYSKLSIDKIDLLLPVRSTQDRVFMVGLYLLYIVLFLFGLEQLRRMIRSAYHHTPFVRSNVRRFYIIGGIALMVPITKFISRSIMFIFLSENYEFIGAKLDTAFHYDSDWLLIGILLITLGIIFEQGIKLQEEQDLTI